MNLRVPTRFPIPQIMTFIDDNQRITFLIIQILNFAE